MVGEKCCFRDEGKNVVVEELGKKYGSYFCMLSGISGGINREGEIEGGLGEKRIGGEIKGLIED